MTRERAVLKAQAQIQHRLDSVSQPSDPAQRFDPVEWLLMQPPLGLRPTPLKCSVIQQGNGNRKPATEATRGRLPDRLHRDSDRRNVAIFDESIIP
jgi:hypothetical protein